MSRTKSSPHRQQAPQERSKLADMFRKTRLSLGLSEREVAEYLGTVSVETLELYEKGQKDIPMWVIYALANCLNISPREIQDAIRKDARK